jgi:hypothetical protein
MAGMTPRIPVVIRKAALCTRGVQPLSSVEEDDNRDIDKTFPEDLEDLRRWDDLEDYRETAAYIACAAVGWIPQVSIIYSCIVQWSLNMSSRDVSQWMMSLHYLLLSP